MHELLSRPSAVGAKCGINAIGRPCQTNLRGSVDGLSFPRHPICQSAGEKIYLVDSDRKSLDEVAAALAWIGTPIECFADPFEFQKAVSSAIAGCVVMDVRIPGFCGRSIQNWLKSRGCDIPIVFLSSVADVATAVECMREGAHDFLAKPPREADLSSAVVSAISQSRMRACQNASALKVGGLLSNLTPAESKVAELISKGYLTKQIASILDRSENTIKIHRHRILGKLGVSSTAALVRMMVLTGEADKSVRGSIQTNGRI